MTALTPHPSKPFQPVAPIQPHGSLDQLAENCWRVEGSLPHFGMHRVMTIAKRADGGLVIHSAVALEEPAMRRVEQLGEPAFLLIPHTRHRMDAPFYKERFPDLCVLATRGALAKARAVVPVDGVYEDFPADARVSLGMLAGTGDHEGWMQVRSSDGITLVLNEVVFDLRERDDLLGRALLRVLSLGPGPRVTPIVKWELVTDRKALRADLEQLAAMPDLARLVVSHERASHGAAARAALLRAAASL